MSSVQRFIKHNALKSAVNPNQKDRKAFEEEYPCGMFQADTSYTCYINENGKLRRTYLIQIVDDHSRLIVGSRFFYNGNAYNFQLVLKEAISRYGLCKKLYLDNESPYANEQLTLICSSLSIVKLHTPVRDGASKAKIERSFKTLKESWLYGFDPSTVSSLKELNRLLADKVRERNTSVNRMIKELITHYATLRGKRLFSYNGLNPTIVNRIGKKRTELVNIMLSGFQSKLW